MQGVDLILLLFVDVSAARWSTLDHAETTKL